MLIGSLLATQSAFAEEQEQDAVKRASARELAEQAADAFDTADYATALDKFTRAQQLYPAPTLAFMQGRCLLALGRWVEAYDAFTTTSRTELEADAPEPYQQAVRDAGHEAQLLDSRLPRIELRVPQRPGLNVSVDGVPLPMALYNVMHPMDPGSHRVTASLGDRPYFDEAIQLVERDRRLVEIPLPAGPEPEPAVTRAPPPPPPEHRDRAAPARGRGAPAWVIPTAFTLGGVGTATAVVSLLLGSDVKAELDDVCESNGACPPAYEDDLQTYRLYRTLFISGAALGATGLGVGLYFVLNEDGESGNVSLSVQPTHAELIGRF